MNTVNTQKMWNGIKLIQIETNVFQVSPYVSHLTIYIYLYLYIYLYIYIYLYLSSI